MKQLRFRDQNQLWLEMQNRKILSKSGGQRFNNFLSTRWWLNPNESFNWMTLDKSVLWSVLALRVQLQTLRMMALRAECLNLRSLLGGEQMKGQKRLLGVNFFTLSEFETSMQR
jgi:hypothetical protein